MNSDPEGYAEIEHHEGTVELSGAGNEPVSEEVVEFKRAVPGEPIPEGAVVVPDEFVSGLADTIMQFAQNLDSLREKHTLPDAVMVGLMKKFVQPVHYFYEDFVTNHRVAPAEKDATE